MLKEHRKNPPPLQVVGTLAAATAAGRTTSHAGPIITRRAGERQAPAGRTIMKNIIMSAAEEFAAMNDKEKLELIAKAVRTAAYLTEARLENPAKLQKLVCDNRDDLEQETALRILAALDRGAIDKTTGEPLPLRRIAARAANAAVAKAWRDIYAHPTAATEAVNNDGDTISVIDIYAGPDVRRPEQPEESAMRRAAVDEVYSRVPEAYRADAPAVMYFVSIGYTIREISEFTGINSRRVDRIIKAVRDAAGLDG